jgi:hypothetical protein
MDIGSDVSFEPWEGKLYRDGIGGFRILILGESHYHSCETNLACREKDGRDQRHRNLTRAVVSEWKDYPSRSPVSSRVPALFEMAALAMPIVHPAAFGFLVAKCRPAISLWMSFENGQVMHQKSALL